MEKCWAAFNPLGLAFKPSPAALRLQPAGTELSLAHVGHVTSQHIEPCEHGTRLRLNIFPCSLGTRLQTDWDPKHLGTERQQPLQPNTAEATFAPKLAVEAEVGTHGPSSF